MQGHGPPALNHRPGEDPRWPEDDGEEPGHADEDQCVAGGPVAAVRQRPGDAEVPVEADQQQIEHRGVGVHVVDGEPEITDGWPHGPAVGDHVDERQWH